jgi:hypothetical protein
MSKNKKDKKESSMFDMIEDMTGIPSEYIWVILAILFILIIVGVLYMLKMGPFGMSPDSENVGSLDNENVGSLDNENVGSLDNENVGPLDNGNDTDHNLREFFKINPNDTNEKFLLGGGIQIFKKR